MNIYDYLQVNSHFVYAKKLNLKFTKNLFKQKINLKQYSNDEFCSLLENNVFEDETIYIHISSKQGEFLLTNVTNDIPHNKIQEYLKYNSLITPTYYFSNVDYFSYGRFGIAEKGKLVRYLAYNCEASDDEDVVVWIGKPHDWEYSTHTFYSKKKLEDCEMSFDSDNVCEMIDFYLPFVKENIDIISCTLYCEDKQHLEKFQKQKIKKQLDKNEQKQIYNFLKDNDIHSFCFGFHVDSNDIIIDSQILHRDNSNDKIEDQRILTNLKIYKIMYSLIDNPEQEFQQTLFEAINDIKSAKITSFIDVANNRKKFTGYSSYYLCAAFSSINKMDIILMYYKNDSKPGTQIYVGNKFNTKSINKIYQTILKLYTEEQKEQG